MKTFFQLRTLDVSYAAVAAKKPKVAIDGAAPRHLRATSQPGLFELELPSGASALEAIVEEPGFWPARQALRIEPGPPPTLAWDGPQEISARDVEARWRGSDANVLLNMVLGQLRDARPAVEEVFEGGGIASLDPMPSHIRDLQDQILAPDGAGWDRLRHTVRHDSLAGGRMFYAERVAAPKLLAIYVPPDVWATPEGEGPTPVPFHIFFHPSTAHMSSVYPFSRDYIDLIARYVLYRQVYNVGKAMVAQHAVAQKRVIFVFPVGAPRESFGRLPRQADLLRALREVSYWLQRMDGVAYPASRVGACAVSGFSSGCAALRTVLETPFTPFERDHLREVYGLDLYQPGNIAGICSLLRRWFRRGADGRRLRVYTQSKDWFANLRSLLPAPSVTVGPDGSMEEETPSSTVLLDPESKFWVNMASEVQVRPELGDFDNVPTGFQPVHQIHPALYMTHALKLSSFPGL